ncbi:MAG: hypothetical protein IJ243_09990 [Prevotella sp.]|nr:hypothetical protein [Prevotella sp.]
MNNEKQIFTRCIAILLLCGIVAVSGYGLYRCITDIDKPVIAETDNLDNSFEKDGQKYYIRNDGIYDERGNLTVGIVEDDENIRMNEQRRPTLDDILGTEKESYYDSGMFGLSKEEMQRLYILYVISTMMSDRTIEVSRWVTSGDWSHDNDGMTIRIP